MADKNFLENTTADKNKCQQFDHLLRITAPHERLILVAIGLVSMALVAWVLFSSITRVIITEGFILKPGARHEITVARGGHLMEYLVAPGELVKAGDPIARQSVGEVNRQTATLGDRMVPQVIASQVAGEVMALPASPGKYLLAGTTIAVLREVEDRPHQVVLRVIPRIAHRILPGMPVSIQVMMSDGTARLLSGEVALVSGSPSLPHWLASLEPAVESSRHRVDVSLHRAMDISLPDSTPLRAHITLGKHSPAALLGFGQF